MKTIKLLLVTAVFFSFFSCKKKENPPEVVATTTGSTPTSTVAYFGILTSYQSDFITSGTLTPAGQSHFAQFCNNSFITTPTISEAFSGTTVDAGTVTLNSITLKKQNNSGNFSYSDTTGSTQNPPLNWTVSGANGIPPINFSYAAARATYTGSASLPDTIKLGQNNFIPLTGIGGADEISVFFFDGSGFYSRTFPGNTTGITITASDLNGFSPSTTANLFVGAFKVSYEPFNGKNFKFKIGHQVFKMNVVIQ